MSSDREKSDDAASPAASKSDGEQHGNASPAAKSAEVPTKKPFLEGLPIWVQNGLTWRAARIVTRATICAWVSFLLLLIQPALNALGSATFFATIASLIVPAMLPTPLYALFAFTLVAGAGIGWGWGCAALGAGYRARDHKLLASQVERVSAAGKSATNPELYYQESVFRGEFLDAKAIATIGVFFVIGTYASAWVQAKRPKLKIAGVFFSIILDVCVTSGSLFPFADYKIGDVLFYPLLCSVAIGLAGSSLIFPESIGYGWQLQMCKLLDLSEKLLTVHGGALHEVSADTAASEHIQSKTLPLLRTIETGVSGLAELMRGNMNFLKMDFSHSYFTPGDLRRIYQCLRLSIIRQFSLDSFLHVVTQSTQGFGLTAARQGVKVADTSDVSISETALFLHLRDEMLQTEKDHHVELQEFLQTLNAASQRSLQAATASLAAMKGWIGSATHYDWRGHYKHDEWLNSLQSSFDELEGSIQAFLEEDRLALLRPYDHMFEADGSIHDRDAFRRSARPLYVCFVFASNYVTYLESLKDLHALVLATAQKRTKRRFHFPNIGLPKLLRLLNSPSHGVHPDNHIDGQNPVQEFRYDTDNAHPSQATRLNDTDDDDDNDDYDSDIETLVDDLEKADKGQQAQRKPVKHPHPFLPVDAQRDPDQLAPRNPIHYFVRFVSKAYDSFWSPEGIYALRYAIVSFALWIPSVLPHSAYFASQNRFLWALIMGQTGLALSGGEMIFTLLCRILGTCGGLVIGMLYWYMSCGLAAKGNAYGLGAVTIIGFIPLVWVRVHLPPQFMIGSIMLAVTTALVLGYSWQDTHIFVIGNVGKGVSVAWRRATLVFAGIAAAVIVTLFPRPPSTRRNVRLGFARSSREILRMYNLIVEGWIKFDADDVEESAVSKPMDDFYVTIRSTFLGELALLGILRRDIAWAPFDIACGGPWPKKQYEELLEAHSRLTQAISQMCNALMNLDVKWRKKMLDTTAILDPVTVSDICVTLTVLADSLYDGLPLPHAFTPLLDRVLQQQNVVRRVSHVLNEKKHRAEHVLSKKMLYDPLFMKHVSGTMALFVFVKQVDRFRSIMIELVGEKPLPGFDELNSRFSRRLAAAKIAVEEEEKRQYLSDDSLQEDKKGR